MAHALVQNFIHVVFGTKDRIKLIPREKHARTWAYLAGICHQQKIFVHEIGGMEDHVHMLIQLPPTLALADAVLKIKASSSKWMGKGFAWQRGYGGFSVCRSTLDAVVRYIHNHEAHHRKMSYEQEFIADDYLLDEGKSFWYSVSMMEITLTASLVYAAPKARFSPSVFAKVHFSVLRPVFVQAFSPVDFAASLEAF
ncbi:MAG TPA: IS200/IS605 family transposase [Candidatus Limnocylindrales bacterium]|nr:IS200/IS605 family transposase [Candidatus Limnocylindrales bacterium]